MNKLLQKFGKCKLEALRHQYYITNVLYVIIPSYHKDISADEGNVPVYFICTVLCKPKKYYSC